MKAGTPNLRLHVIGILIVAVCCLIGGVAVLLSGGSTLDGAALLVAGSSFSYAAYHSCEYLRRQSDGHHV